MRACATGFAALVAGSLAGPACANEGLGVQVSSSPPHGAFVTLAAAEPAAAPDEDARDQYIRRALAPERPPGVSGLRLAGSGTGFFITPDKLLTNFHVVSRCKAMTIGNNNEGEEVDSSLVAGDARADLAVLTANEPDAKIAQFQTGKFDDTAEDLAFVGYPEHGLPVLRAEAGRAAVYVEDLQGTADRYRFYGDVRRGNSGGPLLDSGGAVVGVVTATIDTVAIYKKTGVVVDDVGVAIANRTVFRFLAANGIAYESAPAKTGFSTDEILQMAHTFVRQVRCWR